MDTAAVAPNRRLARDKIKRFVVINIDTSTATLSRTTFRGGYASPAHERKETRPTRRDRKDRRGGGHRRSSSSRSSCSSCSSVDDNCRSDDYRARRIPSKGHRHGHHDSTSCDSSITHATRDHLDEESESGQRDKGEQTFFKYVFAKFNALDTELLRHQLDN